jgi:SAM-dependent methyltransferase
MSTMVSKRFYNAIYRVGAPWGRAPRPELVRMVEDGTLSPNRLPNAIDLGCGTGEDSLFLAQRGFNVVGVDFSSRALKIARKKAVRRGLQDRVRFVEGDLTSKRIPDVDGPFDLLFDGGTLDDLQGKRREQAAETVKRLSHPGSRFLMWCFYGARDGLPWISFVGPSRIAPGFEPGEADRLFGSRFDIERVDHPRADTGSACFLMKRRAGSIARSG